MSSRTVFPFSLLALALAVVPALRPQPLAAQVGGSAFDHDCADCHLRDHEYPVGGGKPTGEGAWAAQAITVMVPGISMGSANCLECHSTEDQRARRIADGNAGGTPLTGGTYLGFVTETGHPLGVERRGSRDRSAADPSRPYSRPGLGWRDGSGLDMSKPTVDCSDCHDPHEYDLRLGVANDERTVCLSCHEPAFYAFNAHVTPTCGDCHQQHNAPGPALTRELDPDALCAACHEGSGRASQIRVDPSLYGPATHVDLKPGQCGDCHRIHPDPEGM